MQEKGNMTELKKIPKLKDILEFLKLGFLRKTLTGLKTFLKLIFKNLTNDCIMVL